MNVCHEAPSHLVYLNVKQLMGEVLVEDELVLVIDLLAARRLLQHPRLSAGQRLQSPAQLSVFDRSQFPDLLQAGWQFNRIFLA